MTARGRATAAVVAGVVGAAILLGLSGWQVQRLQWKLDLIATLESRLAQPPVALPAAPDPARDEFRRVTVRGRFTNEAGAHGFADAAWLTTERPHGPGYRIVQPVETTDGRLILVDRGYAPLAAKNRDGAAAVPLPAAPGDIELVGALRWPQVADFFADPDAGRRDNVWLSREVGALAPLWGAEPLLVVAQTDTSPGAWPDPRPVGAARLRNRHLEYALTWGALAVVWAVGWMLLARRERALDTRGGRPR